MHIVTNNEKIDIVNYSEQNEILLTRALSPAKPVQLLIDDEKKYCVAGGHWHHSELQIDSLYSLRPTFDVSDYSTPIDGLFICGAGTHPGGNLFGLSGLNAAKKIIRESVR